MIAVGIGLVPRVAVWARTGVQVIALGATLNRVCGALGPIRVPKRIMSAFMWTAAAVSSMSWALEGFRDGLLRDQPPAATLRECGVVVTVGGLARVFGCLSASSTKEVAWKRR